MVRAIVGANWGDEGKGKITDMLGQDSDIIIRFQGGANAGHTIVNNYGKFALHTLPSGVFYSHTVNIIGNGVALNIPVMVKELQGIVERGVPTPKILVSDRAQIVMSYHILLDKLEEERLAGKSFGSTKSGIAPFYSDKYAKIGFQVSELFMDEAELKEKIGRVITQKNVCMRCVRLSGQGAERRQKYPAGRPAGDAERSGSRDLSHGDFFFHAGCLRSYRSRHPAL